MSEEKCKTNSRCDKSTTMNIIFVIPDFSRGAQIQDYYFLKHPLAIATDSRIAMIGMMMIAEPSLPAISVKLTDSWSEDLPLKLLLLAERKNGGGWKAGRPDSTLPVRVKTHSSGSVLQLCSSGSRHQANTRQMITTMALRAVQMNQTILSRMSSPFAGSLLVSLWITLNGSPLIGLNHCVLLMA